MKLKLFGLVTILLVAVAVAIQFDMSFTRSSDAISVKGLVQIAPDDSFIRIASAGIDNLKESYRKTACYNFYNDESVREIIEKFSDQYSKKSPIKPFAQNEANHIIKVIKELKILEEPGVVGLIVDDKTENGFDNKSYIYFITPGDQIKLDRYIKIVSSIRNMRDLSFDCKIENRPAVGNIIKCSSVEAIVGGQRIALGLTAVDNYVVLVAALEKYVYNDIEEIAQSIKSGPKELSCRKELDNSAFLAVVNSKQYYSLFQKALKKSEFSQLSKLFDTANIDKFADKYFSFSIKDEQFVIDSDLIDPSNSLNNKIFTPDKNMLKAVPSDAVFFTYGYSDYKGIIDSVDEIDFPQDKSVQSLVAQVKSIKKMVDNSVWKDVYTNLTGEYILFGKTEAMPNIENANISINLKCKDSASLVESVSNILHQNSISLIEDNYNGVTILSKPDVIWQIGPSMAMLGADNVVISSSKEALCEIIELWQSEDKSNSILSNPKYLNAVQDMPRQIYYQHYLDSECFLNIAFAIMHQFWSSDFDKSNASEVDKYLTSNNKEILHRIPSDISWEDSEGCVHIESDGILLNFIREIVWGGIDN